MQVCQYLLEHFINSGRGSEFSAFITQPRRISAITLAERVAEERGETLGTSVGYSVRSVKLFTISASTDG